MKTMEFMHVYERPDLKRVAKDIYCNVEAVFAQEDTWDVHVFIVCRDGDTFVVSMEDVRKESKTRLPSKEDFEEGIQGCPNDESQVDTLKEALDLIVSGNRWEFATPEYIKLMSAAEEEEKLSHMSKYARKKHLQEQG